MVESETDKEQKTKHHSGSPHQIEAWDGSRAAPDGDRLVYVLSPDELARIYNDQIDFFDLWRVLWGGKRIVAAVSALFALVSIAYALLATEWYTANVLLAPAEERSAQGLAAQLGGLAGIAGITVGAGESAEAMAVLESDELARDFIQEFGLVTVLLRDKWDGENNNWKATDDGEIPDIRDAVKVFDEKVRAVSENKRTGLITLSIEWTDPEIAAEWANRLINKLNARMRLRAEAEAERNIAYLRDELAATNIVTLDQSVARLLETEMQKLMLARGNDEFALRVIDMATPPKFRSRPSRTLIVAIGTSLGIIFGVLWVLLANAYRARTTR
jgi:uncharacterized protein involved in exopolysaccharide biosynthesis